MLNAVIDLYRKDSVESWEAVKDAGIHAIIHKATQGTSYVDEKYAKRRAATLGHGFLWGAYHFGDASDPQKQARHFLDTVKSVEDEVAAQLGQAPAPPPLLVLDLEENFLEPSNSMSIGKAEKFVTLVNEQTGRFPGLYAGDDLRSMLNGKANQTLARCWLWLADWREKPRLIAGWTTGRSGSTPTAATGPSPARAPASAPATARTSTETWPACASSSARRRDLGSNPPGTRRSSGWQVGASLLIHTRFGDQLCSSTPNVILREPQRPRGSIVCTRTAGGLTFDAGYRSLGRQESVHDELGAAPSG